MSLPEPAAVGGAFPIVGIGASAGGLEAIEALTARLTAVGMAYLIVQHQSPEHGSMLPDILARGTPLKVVAVKDGAVPEPNTIYVAPPDSDVVIEGGALRTRAPGSHAPRDSIDVMLRSLAKERGAAAIGVILSGAGSDGTAGLSAIASAGGVTFAQTPGTASHPSMPQSAIDGGFVTFTLSPAEIGDELMRQGDPAVSATRPTRRLSEASANQIFRRLQELFGVDFSTYKWSTVERRIERRMAQQGLSTVEDYARLVQTSPEEPRALYDDLLIGVTGFFRDREPFEALVTIVFPKLFEGRSPDLPVRIWVPAAATGEEVYSIAMCLLEFLGPKAPGIKIQIFASDIDDAALHHARLGIYASDIDVDVSPERLRRFFTPVEKGFQISRQLRDLVVFARHNLAKDPPFSRLDLVSCRNVLIYVQPPMQQKILRVFHYGLRPGGFLLLGTSESVGDAADLFSLVDRKLKIYQKKDVSSLATFDLVPGVRPVVDVHRDGVPGLRPALSALEVADRKVIERYGPPGVLVNANFDVIQFRGRTGDFLDPQPGNATFNLFKLVRPELLIALRSAVLKAAGDGEPVLTAPIAMWKGGGPPVRLDVIPLSNGEANQKCLLVLFRQVQALEDTAAPEAGPPAQGTDAERVELLERELLTTKEYLETTVQDLQAANEELQSSNEELQSSNEEMETSKEELQSSNEELATINEELHNRMSQLAVSNDDLQNVLLNASEPLVIVGADLRLRRFSTAAEKLLHLVPADVGRPVGYLAGSIKADVEAAVATAIRSGSVQEQRVRCDGTWYTMQTAPYRNGDLATTGALIELLRTPQLRRAAEPTEIHEVVGRVLSTLPHALALLDDQLRVVWVNQRFFDTFHVGAEILGLPLESVWPTRTDHAHLWAHLDEVAVGGEAFADLRVEHPLSSADEKPLVFSAHRVPGDGERAGMTLLVIEQPTAASLP